MSGVDIEDLPERDDGYYRPSLGDRIFQTFFITLGIFLFAVFIYITIYISTHW